MTFINHIPKSTCCHSEVFIQNIGEEDDPIRETFCSKCKNICSFYDEQKCNVKE